MRGVKQLCGLRYPDDFLIRTFYKECIDKAKPGNVLELGCGSGNNLLLFAEYGWNSIGIDYSAEIIANAKHNFAVSDFQGTFIQHDLNYGIPKECSALRYDVFLAPSCLYYLNRASAIDCLHNIYGSLNSGALFYIRMRNHKDHRYMRGKMVDKDSYVLNIKYTGEHGALNVFYHEYEMLDIIQKELHVSPENVSILQVQFDNFQNGVCVHNCDTIYYGRI